MNGIHYKKLKDLGILFTTASLLAFSGCDNIKNNANKVTKLDPTLELNRNDYRNMTDPKRDGSEPLEPLSVTIDKAAPPVPKVAEILAAPRPPKIGETQLVSIAVTDDVPLKDVLLELAKLADIDIELDAGIAGGISFIAREKPFNEVIDRIANLAGLRYTMKKGVLRVERDTPFIKSYSIDFLNLDRESSSTVSLSTNVLSTSVGGGGGGSAVTTGSTSSVTAKTKADFWEALQSGLDQILTYAPSHRYSTTTLQAETDTTMLTAAAPAANAPGGAAGGAAPQPAPSSAPASASTPEAASTSSSGKSQDYTINRQAGLITLNGTSKQHDLVELMLNKLKLNTSAQVLIEAKILEVDLTEEYRAGINWSEINKKWGAGITFNNVGNALATANPTSDIATVTLASGNFKTLISLVEGFGTTRTLSSPRLHAINNQPSTLTFAVNKVYFDVKATQTPGTTSGSTTTEPTITVTSETRTVPVGIIMSIMPSIDTENNEVTLSVHPTLSTTNGPGVEDPAVKYLAAQVGDTSISSIVPEIQVRELDSTVRMKSGQTMVIGGLMQQDGNNTDAGVPFVSDVPFFGNLFKSVTRSHSNKELVLLIKATIVDTNGSLNKLDKNLFDKFSDDPRPPTL